MTTIILNKEALDALFPEGTEARVKLASATIAAFAQASLKPQYINNEIREAIQVAQRQATDAALREFGCVDGWGRITLNEKARDVIREQAREAVRADVAAFLHEAVLNYTETADVEGMVAAAVAKCIDNLTTRNVVTPAISKAIGDHVSRIVQTKLGA